MELTHYPIRPLCQRWLASIPLALRLSATLRAWTGSEPWEVGQGGVVGQFPNIKRI